jgi:hypothetical protein
VRSEAIDVNDSGVISWIWGRRVGASVALRWTPCGHGMDLYGSRSGSALPSTTTVSSYVDDYDRVTGVWHLDPPRVRSGRWIWEAST